MPKWMSQWKSKKNDSYRRFVKWIWRPYQTNSNGKARIITHFFLCLSHITHQHTKQIDYALVFLRRKLPPPPNLHSLWLFCDTIQFSINTFKYVFYFNKQNNFNYWSSFLFDFAHFKWLTLGCVCASRRIEVCEITNRKFQLHTHKSTWSIAKMHLSIKLNGKQKHLFFFSFGNFH